MKLASVFELWVLHICKLNFTHSVLKLKENVVFISNIFAYFVFTIG